MHMYRLILPAAALAALLLSTGCQNKNAGEDQAAIDSVNATKGVQIIKAEPGPDFPDAQLQVLSPRPDEIVFTNDSVYVKVAIKGFDLQSPTAGEQSKGVAFSKDGQHIHVIIDDKPYMAMYSPDSFSVGRLSYGVHSLRAFLSRSWHESIKKPAAFAAFNFYVHPTNGSRTIKPGEADTPVVATAPLLTYSRPTGTYGGDDAKKILLDFFVANAELGPNKYRVAATIDGNYHDTLTEWVPYFITGLSDGEHTVHLELIGPDGKVVPGRYNITERKFTVDANASTGAAAMGHDTMAHAGGGAVHQ
jgi:hypothetical protein